MPFLATRHRLDTSSDELEKERIADQEPKRLRATSTKPRSEPARAWAPHEHDNFMGIGPVSTPSRGSDSERPGLETRSDVAKPLEGSQMVPNPSGIDETSRGCGSASLE